MVAALEKLADAPSTMALYSLDPGQLVHDETIRTQTVFHGYDILGRADVTDASEQRALVRALASGARESDGRTVALCFNPRHGLHVEQAGQAMDFVICFECLQVHAHGFQLGDGFLITASPQATFDDSLRRHQIPFAPK
jgi:hypothetical protein